MNGEKRNHQFCFPRIEKEFPYPIIALIAEAEVLLRKWLGDGLSMSKLWQTVESSEELLRGILNRCLVKITIESAKNIWYIIIVHKIKKAALKIVTGDFVKIIWEMKMKNYIINIPKRYNGIYAILNIVEKKVYVGLAHDMLRRTSEHFIAISNSTLGNDNQYLLNEENKQFFHFPIYKKQEEIDNLPDLESNYMAVFKHSLGFELYNIAKEKKVELHDKERCLKQVESSFKKLVGESLIEISRLNKSEREIKWNSIVKKFDKSDRETICLESETGDFSKSNKYEYVIRRMATLVIYKSVLRDDLEINWPEKSIKDPDLYKDGVVTISNFGSHNGEIPYEILKKMDIDLRQSSDGCAYWALRRVSEEKFRKEHDGNRPVYVIFKTTTSDNSGGTKVTEKLDAIATEENIREKGQKLKEKNDPTLMQSYKDVENNWHVLPQELTGVSSQTNAWIEGSGDKVVAFKIKKFYICKEDFSFKELLKEVNTRSKRKNSQQSTYDLEVLEKDFDNIEFLNDSACTECIIAELQYPYVVVVNNAPGLKQYLRGWYNGESKPRFMFESKDSKKNSDITRVFMFCTEGGNKTVYVSDVESGKINTISYGDKDLEKLILEDGEKCSYEVIIDEKTEIIKINGSSIKENISFKRKYDAENVSFIKHTDIKYQCLQDSNSGLFYSFRGFKDNKDTPIFVFDEV